jgi:zinc protease
LLLFATGTIPLAIRTSTASFTHPFFALMKKPRSTKTARKPTPTATPAVTVHTLDNGFEVLVREEHSHPLASVQVWVRCGSIHEEAWTGAGLAHLCEHMLFKGTQKRSAQQISQDIQAQGGSVNAYTSFNRTVYYIDGLAEKAEGYMEILADMVQHSKFDPEELKREMDVIRREMAMDNDDANSALQHLLQATAFKKHPLRHPIIGHRQVFDAVGHADLLAFVKRHYSPNNCFLVVTGAVSTAAIQTAAQQLFGDWQRQPYAPVMLPTEPPQLSARTARRSFPTDITRLAIGWPIPGETHEDKPALDALAFILGSGRSSRLYQQLREKRGIAHAVWAGAWSSAECGQFSIDAECDPADAAACQQEMHSVLHTLQQKGPSKAELDKAVRSTMAQQLRSQTSTKGLAATLGSSWMMAASTDLSDRYLESIKALTPARIKEVALRYCQPQKSSTIIVEPEVDSQKTPPGSTAKSSQQKVEKVILKNGLTLLLKHESRLPLISIRAGFLAGVLAETAANAGLTKLSAALLVKGTKKRSSAQIAETLESKGGGLIANADAHRLLLGADVVKGDEATAFELLADLIQQPKLPADQLAILQKNQIASIREEQEDPLTVALRKARSILFASTAFERTALGTETSVKSATPALVRAHLQQHLQGKNGVVAVFGDFDPKRIQQQVSSAFGKLPAGERHFTKLKKLPVKVKPQELSLKLDKEQAVLVIGYRTEGLHDPNSYVLSLIDEACSDMGSRLFNRIREELGLAYYVGAQSFMAYGAGAFYFYVGTDPQKVDLAQAEMQRLIADLCKHGLQADELERAKTTWKSRWLSAQQGNGPMADSLGWDELNGQGMAHFQKLPQLMEQVTVADTQRVAAQYLQQTSAVVVRVLPQV